VKRTRTSLFRRAVMWAAGVVLVVSVAGWVASVSVPDWFPLVDGPPIHVGLNSGCVRAHSVVQVRPASTVEIAMDAPSWLWPGQSGFVECFREVKTGKLLWGVVLPLWIPATFACALLYCLRRAEACTRERACVGICPTCGYDLTGITGPCPECGKEREA